MRFRKQSEFCTWTEFGKTLPAMVVCSFATWIVLEAFAGRFSIGGSIIGLVLVVSGLIPATLFYLTTQRGDNSFFAWFTVMFVRDVAGDQTLFLYFSAWACCTLTVFIIGLGIRVFSRSRAKKPSGPDPSPLWDAQTDGI